MNNQVLKAILELPPDQLTKVTLGLSQEEQKYVNNLLENQFSNPWLKYEDDPVGFIQNGLGETLWSKQKEIVESVRDNKRTVVPACHAPGKSHIASRLVAWWVSVHPPGTAQVVTTATTFRQVRNVLWPHIRRTAARHNLPGEVFTVEWKIGNELAAFGFSPAHHDETAVQGVHAPHLLVVVDEAGGISSVMGRALEALMTGGHTRLLVLGNPPTDNEDSWFERVCNNELYNVITIGAYDTPNFTGENPGICKSCPVEVEAHSVGTHLVDESWVHDVVNEFGEDSAFVEARVHARFPRVTANKVIPLSWIEQSSDNESPTEDLHIKLGVDVAADGGDEFVIARADGFTVSITHRSSGQANSNPVDVAGVILEHIREAEFKHRERNLSKPPIIKIDSIGIGWGVAGILKRWRDEERHKAIIVPVNVAQRARESGKFSNQRAEMWWNARTLIQPIVTTEDVRQDVKLDIDRKAMAQLSGPTYRADSTGRIVIESKKDMKRRGMSSPDRAEAILLALYEPPNYKGEMVAPISLSQPNQWTL